MCKKHGITQDERAWGYVAETVLTKPPFNLSRPTIRLHVWSVGTLGAIKTAVHQYYLRKGGTSKCFPTYWARVKPQFVAKHALALELIQRWESFEDLPNLID